MVVLSAPGECFGPMVPCSSGSADARADIGSGTCSSVSLVLRCAPSQTARPASPVEYGASGLPAHIAAAAVLKVVGERRAVDAQMVAGQRLLLSAAAEPAAESEVSSVETPVPVRRVLLPPAVHPAAGDAPVPSKVELH